MINHLSKNLWLIRKLVLLVVVGLFPANNGITAEELPADYYTSHQFLKDKVTDFREDGTPIGAAAVVPYTYHKGEAYLLLGQEPLSREDKDGNGAWSELGGRIGLIKEGDPETFLQTAVRKLFEESAGMYQISEAYMLDPKYSFAVKSYGQANLLLLAPEYFSAEKLKTARSKQTDKKFHEKDDYLWILAEDLLEAGKADTLTLKKLDNRHPYFFIKTIEGTSREIPIRDYYMNILCDEPYQKLLQQIIDTRPQ